MNNIGKIPVVLLSPPR